MKVGRRLLPLALLLAATPVQLQVQGDVRSEARYRGLFKVNGWAGPLTLDAGTYRVSYDGQELKVGPTEFKLLHYLMKHAERVHSRGQLLDKIWGDHVYIEERTVDVHIRRLRIALGKAHEHLVQTVRGTGYRFSSKS